MNVSLEWVSSSTAVALLLVFLKMSTCNKKSKQKNQNGQTCCMNSIKHWGLSFMDTLKSLWLNFGPLFILLCIIVSLAGLKSLIWQAGQLSWGCPQMTSEINTVVVSSFLFTSILACGHQNNLCHSKMRSDWLLV